MSKKVVAKKNAAKTAAKAQESTVGSQEHHDALVIRANVDVGFGNHLYIRGEGAGLSWDSGQPMLNLDASIWEWKTTEAIRPILFKVLVNDQIWSIGNDYIATPGETTEVNPDF